MVRLLKVKELEDRKRVILSKSEMYRQTMKLEVANIKFSMTLLKRKLKAPKIIAGVAGLAALPLAGFLFAKKKQQPPQAKAEAKAKAASGLPGMLPALLTGFKMYQRFAPMLQKLRSRGQHKQPHVVRRQNLTQHP